MHLIRQRSQLFLLIHSAIFISSNAFVTGVGSLRSQSWKLNENNFLTKDGTRIFLNRSSCKSRNHNNNNNNKNYNNNYNNRRGNTSNRICNTDTTSLFECSGVCQENNDDDDEISFLLPSTHKTEFEYLNNATMYMINKVELNPADLSEINHIIRGWSTKQKNSALYVEQLIKRVVDERVRTGASARHIPLTTEMYNYLISAWVPCWLEGDMTKERAIVAAERAETILRWVLCVHLLFVSYQPKSHIFNSTFGCSYTGICNLSMKVVTNSSDQISNHLMRVLGRGIILLHRRHLFALEKY